jgi:hypothetical protein
MESRGRRGGNPAHGFRLHRLAWTRRLLHALCDSPLPGLFFILVAVTYRVPPEDCNLMWGGSALGRLM